LQYPTPGKFIWLEGKAMQQKKCIYQTAKRHKFPRQGAGKKTQNEYLKTTINFSQADCGGVLEGTHIFPETAICTPCHSLPGSNNCSKPLQLDQEN